MIVITLVLLFASQGQAPSLQALASTSADSRLPQDNICRDEAILRRSDTDLWARVFAPQQTWMSHMGDSNADGVFDLPDGIDAVTYLPSVGTQAPSIFDLAFSSDRDFLGFQDGDILHLSRNGGMQVLHSETELEAVLLPSSGSLDIDALAFVSASVYRFSLKDGLVGTVLGDLSDGDVLEWDISAGSISLIATEAEVQAWVTNATGSASAIGDVKALSFHPVTGEMLFTVQSPSSIDATVFAADQNGTILVGWEEDDWGFQISTEIDALSFIPAELEQPVILSTDVNYLHPGESFQLRVRHAAAGTRLSGMAGPQYQVVTSTRGGVGYAVLDLGVPPIHRWPAPSASPLFADSNGGASYMARTPSLPAGMTSVMLWYQVFAHGMGWSSPVAIRVE